MTLRTYKILLLADPCDVEYKLTVKALQEAFAQNPECQVFINTKVSLFSGFLGFFFRLGSSSYSITPYGVSRIRL